MIVDGDSGGQPGKKSRGDEGRSCELLYTLDGATPYNREEAGNDSAPEDNATATNPN